MILHKFIRIKKLFAKLKSTKLNKIKDNHKLSKHHHFFKLVKLNIFLSLEVHGYQSHNHRTKLKPIMSQVDAPGQPVSTDIQNILWHNFLLK